VSKSLYPAPGRRLAALAFAAAATMACPAQSVSRWSIDPARTQIAFEIDAVGYPRTHGEFRKFDGRIAIDFEHPDRSRVAFRVDSSSVDVGSAAFNDYLRSVAFLNDEKFPEVNFVSTSVEKLDETRVRVTGDLTLLGVTKPLTVEVVVRREGEGGRQRLVFGAETHIDRLEFGMNSGYPIVSRDVDLKISTTALDR